MTMHSALFKGRGSSKISEYLKHTKSTQRAFQQINNFFCIFNGRLKMKAEHMNAWIFSNIWFKSLNLGFYLQEIEGTKLQENEVL